MATISRFEEIEAWQLARELTNLVYGFTTQEKFSRDFGLKDQIRRATVSVMSNIAEGFESQTQAQFIRYLGIAKASAAEVRSLLYVALDQRYITQAEFQQAFDLAYQALRKIVRFASYLELNSQARQVRDERAEYLID
ncbi:MAG: four helix bundle protein [Chloroflexi bacterium]|nr:MAG: four helix bundle protein [Chloroflexota bacterium]